MLYYTRVNLSRYLKRKMKPHILKSQILNMIQMNSKQSIDQRKILIEPKATQSHTVLNQIKIKTG